MLFRSVTGIGSYGGTNQYKDRIFVGDDGSNVFPVGGHYYTSMMEHAPGTVAGVQNTRNTDGGIVAVLDDNRKVDQWNVDNLRLDGNVISSTDTDGNVVFDPNGTGEVNIVDDTFLSFGTDQDVKFEYDEDGTDRLLVSGKEVMFNTKLNVSADSVFGKVRIENNVISSVSGSGDKLFIDPFPDGLSNQGDVIVKGNLQVDGTTTSVNSTNVTVNDPIFTIGDVTSDRTVMQSVATGVSTITVDSIVGINTGDIITGSSALPNSGLTTVTTYDIGSKMITIEGTTTAGITTTSVLTVTHAFDTNTDRGIAFNYNTGIGTANAKTGLFHKAIVQSGIVSHSLIEDAESYYPEDGTSGIQSSKEVINRLLINDKKADSTRNAKDIQNAMSLDENLENV